MFTVLRPQGARWVAVTVSRRTAVTPLAPDPHGLLWSSQPHLSREKPTGVPRGFESLRPLAGAKPAPQAEQLCAPRVGAPRLRTGGAGRMGAPLRASRAPALRLPPLPVARSPAQPALFALSAEKVTIPGARQPPSPHQVRDAWGLWVEKPELPSAVAGALSLAAVEWAVVLNKNSGNVCPTPHYKHTGATFPRGFLNQAASFSQRSCFPES